MKTTTVNIKGMHCASCAVIIKNTLKKSKHVKDCSVNIATEKATIIYDPNQINIDELSKSLEPFGYTLLENTNKPTTHTMPDGTTMTQNEHTEHIGLNENKEEKIAEIKNQKNKVEFVLPITLFIFVSMMWEILAKTISTFPKFFIPMELFNILVFILASIFMFWVGQPFIAGIIRFIKYKVANMDTLIGMGTLTAYFYSSLLILFPKITSNFNFPETTFFDVTIVVIGFIILGKYLESRSKLKTGEAIEKLLNLQAKTATIERDGKIIEIDINKVVVGDIIIVKPGGKIPVDGVITEGNSSVDESMITGEPIPVDKSKDDFITGGTINKQGSFKYRATKVGSQTLLAQIIKMVEQAQGSRAPIQNLADKVSEFFVPLVLLIAIATLLGWVVIGSLFISPIEAFSLGIVCFVGVLVIACPCALGLATPTAIITGVGKGAENGILIKNAESLEKLHKIQALVLDKTGTLTNGKPVVTDIIPIEKITNTEILTIVGSLENNSEHPLALAIMEKIESSNIKLEKVNDFEIIEGKGLKGKINKNEYFVGNIRLVNDLNINFNRKALDKLASMGKTPVILMNKNKILAIIAIADTIKDTAKETIKSLHKLGIKIIMLTGDNKYTANYIGKQLGIDNIFAEVLPNQKSSNIKKLQDEGLIVAMAGDGVNDAPALAQADVGIAMGSGTDVAIESADITLLKGDIAKISKAIKLSKKTIITIKQNLFWAFIYNVLGIPFAAGILYPLFGLLLNPVFAGLAMAFSSLSVVSNSLRLKNQKL